MRLSETNGIVYVFKPGDHGSSGVKGDSINTKYCTHVTFLLQLAGLTDNGSAGAVLTVKSGAGAGTETTAEEFYYRTAGAAQGAAGADVYAAETGVKSLELLKATFENKLLIVEVPVAELTEGQPWITLSLSDAGTAANASCVAILSGMKYKANQPPSSI